MPGLILNLGSTIVCSHSGSATPGSSDARVLVDSQPVIVASTTYSVAGCVMPVEAGGPCVTGQFTTPATRVMASGVPVLINSSPSVCAPTGTPLIPTVVQSRVIAT